MTTHTSVEIHAAPRQALAYTPPRITLTVSDKHVALAFDQLAEELELGGIVSQRDQHYHDFIERINDRSRELAMADAQTRPTSTKFMGIAIDACGLLQELQTLIVQGDTAKLCEVAEQITPILAKLRSNA